MQEPRFISSLSRDRCPLRGSGGHLAHGIRGGALPKTRWASSTSWTAARCPALGAQTGRWGGANMSLWVRDSSQRPATSRQHADPLPFPDAGGSSGGRAATGMWSR